MISLKFTISHIQLGQWCSGSFCEQSFPLIALGTNNGINWYYPSSVYSDLTTRIDPNLIGGYLDSASCFGSGTNNSVCIASGVYYTNTNLFFPLIALSSNGGTSWTYPKDVFTDLPARIGPRYEAGYFNVGSCAGNSAKASCIGAGAISTPGGSTLPFIGVSRDGGTTWNYPKFIYTKMKVVVDPDFKSGSFEGATCATNGKLCLASGGYCKGAGCDFGAPLIALSSNGGKDWSYPPSVYSNLTTKIDPNFKLGYFTSVHCSGNSLAYNFCTASGFYVNETTILPLTAYSVDSGTTWIYPAYIHENLNTTIDQNFSLGWLSRATSSGGQFSPLSAWLFHAMYYSGKIWNKLLHGKSS